jgi:hypothetical protein
MTYACPASELAADTCLLKLQRMENKVLRTIGNFPRCTPVLDLHTTFNLPYVYDYITKLCRQKAEIIQNHENEHIGGIGQGKPDIEIVRGLNLAVVKLMTVQVNKLSLLHMIRKIGMICSVKPLLTEDLCIVKKEEIFNNMPYV